MGVNPLAFSVKFGRVCVFVCGGGVFQSKSKFNTNLIYFIYSRTVFIARIPQTLNKQIKT